MRQLRIFKRVVIETGIGLRRSGWSNWLVVSILTVALTIFGGVLELTSAIKNVVHSWGSQLEISAYLKDGYDPGKVAHAVGQIPEVQVVEIVPKDVAWADMQASFKVAALNNPLPNTLHIHMSSSEAVERTAARLKNLEGIEHIRYAVKVARSLNKIRDFLEIAGYVVTAALAAATLTVIGNTIHLVIDARRREIEILSLMGVGPLYIKGPLILQGAIYGTVAAVLAMLFLLCLHLCIDPKIHEQLLTVLPMLTQQTFDIGILPRFLSVLLLGVVVGAGGSAWTSGRYIKI